MTIVRVFMNWRSELESVESPIQVLLEYKNLKFFMSNKTPSRPQVLWVEYLSRFNFQIVYQLGKKIAKLDASTRWSGDLPGEENKLYQTILTVKKAYNITCLFEDTLPGQWRKSYKTLRKKHIATDNWTTQVMEIVKDKVGYWKRLLLPDLSDYDQRFLYKDRLVVPDYSENRLRLMQIDHHSLTAENRGLLPPTT